MKLEITIKIARKSGVSISLSETVDNEELFSEIELLNKLMDYAKELLNDKSKKNPPSMERCPECKRRFFIPEDIGSILALFCIHNERVTMCPLCYAKAYEETFGIIWSPKGEIASAMFSEAKRQYPDWSQK